MQISRHWRMKAQRYRLEGVRYENGAVNIQARPALVAYEARQQNNETVNKDVETQEVAVAIA
jgi:hypothetical protein